MEIQSWIRICIETKADRQYRQFILLLSNFLQGVEKLKENALAVGLTEAEFNAYLVYCSGNKVEIKLFLQVIGNKSINRFSLA